MKKLIVFSTFMMLSSLALAGADRVALLNKAKSMSANEIFKVLTTIDKDGRTEFGKCRVALTNQWACNAYFKAGVLGTYGHDSWPKNPASGDSTGCMDGCWGGYTSGMCTGSYEQKSKVFLEYALAETSKDVCDLANQKPANTDNYKLSIRDSSKLLFVKPGQSCSKDKVICGTTKIGDAVGGHEPFTKLPDAFCKSAYLALKRSVATFKSQGKAVSSDGKFISCDQYAKKSLASSELAQAASVVGQLNEKIDIMYFLPQYLDMNEAQLGQLPLEEVALFWVAAKKPSTDNFPAVLKTKVAALTALQISKAEEQVAALNEKVKAGTYDKVSLEGALAYIKNGGKR